MAHPGMTKGFLQLSPEAAMLPGPRVETRPLPPVPSFLLAQNLSPKDIAGSDITSWKLYDAYMRLSHIIGLKHDIPYSDHYGSLEHFWSAIYMIRTQYRANTKQT